MLSDPQYQIAWLIPLFPLIGFLFNGLVGHRVGRTPVAWVACLAMLASFAVAVDIFLMVQHDPGPHINTLATWLTVPALPGSNIAPLQVNWEVLLDPLTALMLLIITGVGGLIHVYSTGYMASDKGHPRFFTYLNLFIVFMLLLVMGNNLLMMFVGWEGVGLCSYLLIGFYYEKPSAAAAALKAMVVNRVGDVGVLLGMFLAYRYFGTLDFHTGSAGVPGLLDHGGTLAGLVQASPLIATVITTICLMIFWGCTGKSAQLPLYTWLPDAMEGPTPVSALIHAATMVTAGVYLVTRLHGLFELSDLAMTVVAVIGISTALFAASIGLVQNDIKRILAYSTVSQLGYMFAACGVGAFAAGMFHVMTHAFFKACLFLGSGIVIHAMEHAIHERHEAAHGGARDGHGTESAAASEHNTPVSNPLGPDPDDPQDVRNMGGLKSRLPKTHWMMWISTMAIAGIPLFSGFFSKDEILGQAAGASWLLWLVGVVTAFMTAFYMMRLMFKTFYGAPKSGDAAHAHESGSAMIAPVVVLGILALIGGYIGMPKDWLPDTPLAHSLFGFLALGSPSAAGALPQREPFINDGTLLLISSLVALLGVLASYFGYKAKDGCDLIYSPQDKLRSFTYQSLLNKYWVDESYWFFFTKGGRVLSNVIYDVIDLRIVDGVVNGVAWLTGQFGAAARTLQTGYVRNYAFSMLIGVLFVVIACYIGYHSYGGW